MTNVVIFKTLSNLYRYLPDGSHIWKYIWSKFPVWQWLAARPSFDQRWQHDQLPVSPRHPQELPPHLQVHHQGSQCRRRWLERYLHNTCINLMTLVHNLLRSWHLVSSIWGQRVRSAFPITIPELWGREPQRSGWLRQPPVWLRPCHLLPMEPWPGIQRRGPLLLSGYERLQWLLGRGNWNPSDGHGAISDGNWEKSIRAEQRKYNKMVFSNWFNNYRGRWIIHFKCYLFFSWIFRTLWEVGSWTRRLGKTPELGICDAGSQDIHEDPVFLHLIMLKTLFWMLKCKYIHMSSSWLKVLESLAYKKFI